MYEKLKQHYLDVKNHADLTTKSIPFFENKLRDIQYELLKISNQQGEQQSKEVSNAIRFMELTDREDLFNIKSYPRDTAKLLGRAKDKVLTHLLFAAK